MPAKRTYNVKGSKDFLVLTGIFFFLCLWAVKDAWYPSPGVMKKHPPEVVASFGTAGTVGQVHVAVGDSIAERQLLVELRRSKIKMKFDEARKNYTAAKNEHILAEEAFRTAEQNGAAAESMAGFKEGMDQAQTALNAALEEVGVARTSLESIELRAPTKGEVKEIFIRPHSQVEADETVLVIDPKDHFYLFNKSLAIFSFIAFWVFLGLHILAH
jgi:multidrug resistance efflux pump